MHPNRSDLTAAVEPVAGVAASQPQRAFTVILAGPNHLIGAPRSM